MPSLCPTCGKEKETQVHVLLLCPRACQVWRCIGLDGFFIHAVHHADTFLELLQQGTGHCPYTLLAYIMYHTWLTRNAIVFNSIRCSAKVIVERDRIHMEEYLMTTALTLKTWGFCSALRVAH